jgi:hypothetical protein
MFSELKKDEHVAQTEGVEGEVQHGRTVIDAKHSTETETRVGSGHRIPTTMKGSSKLGMGEPDCERD